MEKDGEVMEETVERIRQMEHYFDRLRKIAERDPSAPREPEAGAILEALIRYYEGGQWLRDYELDEQGLLPPDLKRGVLSEDGVYDLLARLRPCCD